jgi:DNA-binding NtrC family response regulator
MSDSPESVLLVDDEQSILNVLSMGFKKAGLTTTTALNAEDALKLLETMRFDAVVTDKNLPGKSGIDLIKAVSQSSPHCARIVITGFANTESVLEAMRLGADDYLLKPFENIMLVAERVKHAVKFRRVHAEREALGNKLRELEKTLRKSEETAFKKGTELDLFQNVVELKIDDATRELQEKVAALEAQVALDKDKRVALKRTLEELAKSLQGELARRLLAEAEILGE